MDYKCPSNHTMYQEKEEKFRNIQGTVWVHSPFSMFVASLTISLCLWSSTLLYMVSESEIISKPILKIKNGRRLEKKEIKDQRGREKKKEGGETQWKKRGSGGEM